VLIKLFFSMDMVFGCSWLKFCLSQTPNSSAWGVPKWERKKSKDEAMKTGGLVPKYCCPGVPSR
jgi:hypothetical protein